MKKVFALLAAVLLVLALAGCGASNASGSAAYDSAKGSYVAEAPMAPEEAYWDSNAASYGGASNTAAQSEGPVRRSAKLVYTANMTMETLEFDKAVEDIDALVQELHGYFQQRSVHQGGRGYRYAEFTVRVPAEHFTAFCNQVGQLCHVTYANSGAEDISDSYYDTESRLTTAKAKLARLQELLEKAEDMEDIITIENAISDTEWQIDRLSGTMRDYDSLVDYATVTVDLNEVYKLSGDVEAPMTFSQRLGSAFTNGLKSVAEALEALVMWLAYSWVWLVILAAVIVVAVRLIRKKSLHLPRLRRKNKKTKNEPEIAENSDDNAQS